MCVLNEGVTFVARTSDDDDADGKLYVLARVGGRGGVGWSGNRGVGRSVNAVSIINGQVVVHSRLCLLMTQA